ncbi:hypothetical protein AAFF_G00287780 [Aldrovandia affinis]|uniref:Uncharacterized protein n=1 Tax=Aldrovandia affinis TaxID=143900 RepID=A0AAD7SQQ2_9TELE|nr:hypothetical protein AAFF_G00287780 [Aldrovandia affinis]
MRNREQVRGHTQAPPLQTALLLSWKPPEVGLLSPHIRHTVGEKQARDEVTGSGSPLGWELRRRRRRLHKAPCSPSQAESGTDGVLVEKLSERKGGRANDICRSGARASCGSWSERGS